MSLTKEHLAEIWKNVRANHDALEACAGPHDFQRVDSKKIGSRWRCSKCGGEIDGVALSWYRAGLKHAAILRRVPAGEDAAAILRDLESGR